MRIWLMAARLRTLPAAIAPVLVGTALAGFQHVDHPLRLLAALLGAIFIQVGTNLSNDYSDARRGADAEDRLGPVRVTAGGLVPPRQVLIATYVSFGLAVLAGIYLIVVAGWLLLVIGVASIIAGVLYTGGPRPYGYEGLGEVFVFLFFGVVAVAGSYFVQVRHLDWEAFALSVPVGLLASAILVVNNVRDIDSDRRAGKRTLAVRLGRERTRVMFAVMLGLAFVLALVTWVFGPLGPWVALCWLAAPLAVTLVRTVATHTDGPNAQRRARPLGHAAARVLRAALRGRAPQPVKLSFRTVRRTLRGAGHRAAHGTVSERELVLVSLEAGDGLTGHGEAAPLSSYDGVGVAEVIEALEDCRPVLDDYPGHAPIADVIARCGEQTIVAQALAAIDLALWDLAGQRVSEPVWRLLGAADGGTDPGQLDDRRTGPLGRCQRGRRGTRRRLPHGEGEGRHRRRRRPPRRRPRLRRPADGDPHRRQRRLDGRGSGRACWPPWSRSASSCARNPSTAWRRSPRCAACGIPLASRRDRPPTRSPSPPRPPRSSPA